MNLTGKRTFAAFAPAVLILVLGGCYEELNDTSAVSTPPDAPPSSTPSNSYGAPPQSALGGAKRAAINTRDKVGEYQRRLEEEMEDNN